MSHSRTEKELEYYRKIFKNSKDALLILKNRQFIDCNDAALDMLGYEKKSDFLSSKPSQLSPPFQSDGRDSFDKAQEMMDLAIAYGSFRFVWIHRKADGTDFPVEVLLTTLSSEENEEIIYTTWRDISDKQRALDQILESEERFRSLVETTNDFIWEVDKEARYTYVSPQVRSILGVDPDEMIGKTPFDFMAPDVISIVREKFGKYVKNNAPFESLENVNLHKSGRRLVLETSGVPFTDAKGEYAGYRGIDRDITNRKTYEEQLLLTESVFQNSIEGIAVTDSEGYIKKVNRAFTVITGYSGEDVLDKNPRVLKSDRHDELFYASMWKDLVELGQWSGEIWNRRKDGTAYPEWLSISAIKDEEGKTANYISLFHDISEDKRKEETMEFLAFHDPLTKLPNRRLFYDRLNVSLEIARRNGKMVALFYMDIDNFKDINDNYGHPFGDDFLCAVKDRISTIIRKSDTFARYGGDEFVIILNGIDSAVEAREFSDRLIALFKDPLSVRSESVFTSISVGLTLFPTDGEDMVTLEKNADMALYKAKKEGKRQTFQFHAELNESAMKRNALVTGLRKAVKSFEGFSLMYQPKIDIHSCSVYGFEALIRWELNGEKVSPDQFIPLAEEANLIVPLGKWILKQAMIDMQYIHEKSKQKPGLAINLSTRQFLDDKLFDHIEQAIEESGFDRKKLLFEITEGTSAHDIGHALEIMEEFKSRGFPLSIDDFGTGYSSLSYLKSFPLQELKIDRSFIMDIPDDPNDEAICKTIINMANSLNYSVVAEGVETKEQLEFLDFNGCHIIQGYYFHKPLTPDEAIEVLKKYAI